MTPTRDDYRMFAKWLAQDVPEPLKTMIDHEGVTVEQMTPRHDLVLEQYREDFEIAALLLAVGGLIVLAMICLVLWRVL